MAKKPTKSVLDGIPVKDEAFPLNKEKKNLRGIVGHCVRCGAPIYGHAVTDEESPRSTKSCDCFSCFPYTGEVRQS